MNRLSSLFPHLLRHGRSSRCWLACAICALIATASLADPRIRLVELQGQRNHLEALQAVDELLASNPELARQLGLHYLRGHLLMLLERRREGLQAFATTMSATPKLSPYSRYRLALEQQKAHHPEVAAGLVATLLGANPPRSLVAPGLVLLDITLRQGGDCRLLRSLSINGLRKSERRRLTLARARCALRGRDEKAARELYLNLLKEARNDEVARSAAERLHQLGANPSIRTQIALGLTFYSHREFDTAIGYLERSLELLPDGVHLSRGEVFECRYAVARSHFWEGRYGTAAEAFNSLAEITPDAERKAQVIYQQARCQELDGQWDSAILSFRRALEASPKGRWADGSLIAFMRLQWLLGRQGPALSALETLAAERHFSVFSRAALFIASSELVAGESELAGPLLQRVARLGRTPKEELAYWQGRFLELTGAKVDAVEAYLDAIRPDPNHPFARAAILRLGGSTLAAQARRAGLLKAASAGQENLYSAWLLLGDDHPRGRRAHQALTQHLATDPTTRTYLELRRQAPATWPIWKANLPRPEEMLLALGLFGEAESVVMRHFPVAQPHLAFTSSLALAEAGADHRSLYIAEVLKKKIPKRLPHPFLPKAYRQLLYPMGFSYLIRREASRRDIDPYLLAAIIREESRFQPKAFSGAAARGLTQFIFPTARRIAEKFSLGPIDPEDLDRPEIAIALGAAYLAELGTRFAGSVPAMAAAYNAGEPQSALWGRYCLSDDPTEFYTKIAFPETRNYVRKVLTSQAHYSELYRPQPAPTREE